MLNDFKFYIVIYLIVSMIFNQNYKLLTQKNINDGILTTLIQFVAVITCLLLLPFFKFRFPTDFGVYLFLFLSIIFYTINDRLGTTARKGLDSSIYIILKQLSTVFMIIMGILFFKEPFIFSKFLGAILIVLSNVIVFYKKIKFNKYFVCGIIANICLSVALFLDVNNSNKFNLAFYLLLIFLIPLILIFIFERIRIKDIIKEYKKSNKTIVISTGVSWVIMMLTKLKSYELGSISIVAPLTSLTVILNIFCSYFILKEKNNLLRKVIASILIIIGVILIKK